MKISGIKINPTGRLRITNIFVPPPEPTGPQWVNEANLGTFTADSEVVIDLTYTDPDSTVTGMSLTGSLPFGVQFNAMEQEISGVITAAETTRYDFTLNLITTTGLVSKAFYFTASIPVHGVTWLTNSALGEFDGGQGLDLGLAAETSAQ